MIQHSTRWIKAISMAITLVAVMGLTAISASAKDDGRIDLKPGTVIPVTLNSELSSATANTGDTFTATVDSSRDYYGRNLAGATITGYVKSVSPQAGDQPGMIEVAFTRLDLPDGKTFTINGEPTSLDSKYVTTDRDGMLVAKTTGGHRGLRFAGIGAGVGALVGVLATGGLSLWDTIAGAGIGYGASTINKPPSDQKYHNIDLQPGTEIGVLLNDRVTYYHRVYPAAIGAGGSVQIGIEQDRAAQGLPLPTYQSSDSMAMPIVAANDNDVTIAPGTQAVITTGLRFSVPAGYELQLRPDLMLAQQQNLSMMNGPMTIGTNDTGIVRVTLFNNGQSAITIHRGDRIAHLVVTQVIQGQFNPATF